VQQSQNPTDVTAVRFESYFPCPWTVRVEVRAKTARHARASLERQFDLAMAQLDALIGMEESQ
jgi:hypothetical protein